MAPTVEVTNAQHRYVTIPAACPADLREQLLAVLFEYENAGAVRLAKHGETWTAVGPF